MSNDRSVRVDKVEVSFGAVRALRDVSVEFPGGVITGLLGPNGAGKTTLLNVISGFQKPTSGSVLLDDEVLEHGSARSRVLDGVVRTFQTVRLLERESVFDNVALGCEPLGRHFAFEQSLALPRGRKARRRDLDLTMEALTMMGIERHAQQLPSELPYAKRRLVEIARAVVSSPRVLLLDEPMAGLDPDARMALLETLIQIQQAIGMTMIVVEHDIDVVRRLCSQAVVLASGGFVAAGQPDTVVADPRVRTAYFGNASA